ncbi:hypothetical protein NON20_17165 [Synechocystis sp. B12]|nr:hypothetical protein NON20_17165 [Synechocystis sp. B12]
MDFKSLRAYVIKHQDDNEVFYAFVDGLKANPSSPVYPPPNTPENISIVEQAIKDKVAALKQKHESNSAITIEVNLSLQDADKIREIAEQLQVPVTYLAQEIIHRYLGGELVEKQS